MFADFALHERLLKAVAELNFTEPTPVQREAIPPALAGKDLRVIAQTGSGKTAAFALPLLNRLIGDAEPRVRVRALILLPTRELAQQTLKEMENSTEVEVELERRLCQMTDHLIQKQSQVHFIVNHVI